MADRVKSTVSSSKTDDNAIYHDVSPRLVLATKLYGVITCCMVSIAFIVCLAQGSSNNSFYLLATNLIISSFVGMVVSWWYKRGDLPSDKLWFIILVCSVIFLQCITTDIYVFNIKPTNSFFVPTTTSVPIRNITGNMSGYAVTQATNLN